MRRIRFGGYTVEIDPKQGMISRHPTVLHLLVLAAFSGPMTLVCLAFPWALFFRKPSIQPSFPPEGMTWVQWVGCALFSIFFAVIDVVIGFASASAFLRTIWYGVTGRGTQVLDRDEGRCRQGIKTLFELGQVASVGVVTDQHVEVENEGIVFNCKDGSTHYWLAYFSVGMPKCRELARDIASFLEVPLGGDGSEKPPSEAHPSWPEIA